MIGIHHGAAFERLHGAHDLGSPAFDRDFGARRDIADFLETHGQTVAMTGRWLLLSPSEFVRGGGEHDPLALVLAILQVEFKRIDTQRMSDFVDVALSREVIGGGSEATVRSDAQ